MNYGKILAWINITTLVVASIGYFWVRDWRRGLYYFFAAGLTVTVTYE